MNWFFAVTNNVVHLDARLEDGDRLGDAHVEVHKGEDFYGVSYDAMKQAGSGTVEVGEDGKGRIGD